MRSRRTTLVTMLGVTAFAVAMAVPAQAATPATTTYHGTFTSVAYDGPCTPAAPDPTPAVTGVWNVSLHNADGTATFTVDILLDGKHHVSYGIPGKYLPLTDKDGATFSFQFETLAGELEVYLSDGTLTYHFPDGYDYGGLNCPDVVYSGPLTH